MKRHDWWRARYHIDPYMSHLDESCLKVRFENVLGNACTVTDELKLGLLSTAMRGPEATNFWGIAFTHLLEEFGVRGFDVPPNIDRSIYACLDWPNLTSAVAPFKESRRSHSQALVKYGNVAHLREAFSEGRIRVNAAASYNDPSLNRAVRDDELSLAVDRRSNLFDRIVREHGVALRPLGPAYGVRTEVLKAPTNYYVYCLCMLRSFRMFGDFQANGALVIHDTKTFVRRLGQRVLSRLGPGWSWFATPVRYVDPLRPQPSQLNVVECKHFSFTYQHEYRIVWLPDSPVFKLEPLFVEIGSLRDIAKLVELVSR
jgi:hypothetical protein